MGARAPAAEAGRRRRRLAGARPARSAVLAAPLRITVVQAVPWIVAVPLFATINAFSSLTVALTVACVVALGGVATVAVAYRLSELALRGEVAQSAEDPPNGSAWCPAWSRGP